MFSSNNFKLDFKAFRKLKYLQRLEVFICICVRVLNKTWLISFSGLFQKIDGDDSNFFKKIPNLQKWSFLLKTLIVSC
jgi:hypothetical protein